MKTLIKILTVLTVLTICSCGAKTQECNADAAVENPDLIVDREFVFNTAIAIVNEWDNDNIWSLSDEIDTARFAAMEDFFTNTETKNKLVLVGMDAGTSAGNTDYLLILFDALDSTKVLWAGQESNVFRSGIADLNGDGIKEILSITGATWMGLYVESCTVYNFKDGKKNILFETPESAYYFGDDFSIFQKGDTIEYSFVCSIDKNNELQQTHTVKIFNGGKTEKEVLKKQKMFTKTENIIIPK